MLRVQFPSLALRLPEVTMGGPPLVALEMPDTRGDILGINSVHPERLFDRLLSLIR